MGLDVFEPFRLDGRTAIVTGASSGLGARFAQVLAGAGASVVVAARRADRIEALAKELDGFAVPCDVVNGDDRERLVATTLERFGKPRSRRRPSASPRSSTSTSPPPSP